MMAICPQCQGRRTVTTMVPNTERYNGIDYASTNRSMKPQVSVCPSFDYAGVVSDDQLDAILRSTLAQSLAQSDVAAESL